MESNSIIELILLIQKRPAAYITRNYISCLKAYIDGWYFRNPETLSDGEAMGDFHEWIVKKYKVSTNHSWCDIILFYSQDETSALATFFKDFNQWRASNGKKME